MDNLCFVLPTIEHEDDAIKYVEEFIKNESQVHGSGGLYKYVDDYKKWLEKIKRELSYSGNEKVPANTYFVNRIKDNKIVGMVNIRHRTNDYLFVKGGYIGYSVRPTERRKGYATEILRMGLVELKNMGIEKVLLTCDQDNIGSVKTIKNNGGELENELLDVETGKMIQRYWIKLI